MNNPLFTPAPFFLVRAAILPLDTLNEILSKKNWQEPLLQLYQTNSILREAIAIASPSLYKSLENKQNTNLSKALLSLLNYVIRMSTRTTPFGMFSFVANGEWGNQTQAFFEIEKLQKKARPDMEWVYAYLQKLYSDTNLLNSLPIRKNPLASISGGRVYLNYNREINRLSSSEISINANELIIKVLALSEESIPTGLLMEKVLNFDPTLNEAKLKEVIINLLVNQILVPGLLPSLLSNSPCEELFPKLPSSSSFKKIMDYISLYNRSTLGKGEQEFNSLQKVMEADVSSTSYLQVDSILLGSPFKLPKTIGKELSSVSEFLFKISKHRTQFSELKNYHGRFIEKYGTCRTVPLLELLDEDRGLGSFLNEDSKKNIFSQSSSSQRWDHWLHKKWQECLVEGQHEIVIEEKIIQELFDSSEEFPPFSFDLFFKIIAKSQEDIDKGRFELLSYQSSWQGASTFGRFTNLLGEDVKEKIKKFYTLEEQLESESFFVELSYFPRSPRSANVVIRPLMRKYKLDLEAANHNKNSMRLEDIYVGATTERFYLTLNNGGSEVNACIGNMLNTEAAPLPLRFMQEITLAKHHCLAPFSWGIIQENAHFLPRVRLGKTIISPARWNLDFNSFEKKISEITSSDILSWATCWSLPGRCLLADGDRQLLIDLSNSDHIMSLIKKLKAKKPLQFIEYFADTWLKSPYGSHTSEIVLPFIRNPDRTSSSIDPLPFTPVSLHSRLKVPSSEWLFFKAYMKHEKENDFLTQQLSPLANDLIKEGTIFGWYFVRYRDPNPHLRVRFRLKNSDLFPQFTSMLRSKIENWISKGMAKDVMLVSYDREVERYGGEEFIDGAEAVFCADACATITILRESRKEFPHHESILHAVSIINFLSDLGLNYEESALFLRSQLSDYKELKGFREHKHTLISIIKNLHQNRLFTTASSIRNPIIRHFSNELKKSSKINFKAVIASILHMHCNRLGCNRKEEKRAFCYANGALKSILKLSI